LITEIKKGIYTAAFSEIFSSKNYQFKLEDVIDVRDLVDHSGNNINYILKAIDDAKTIYHQKGLVVIACDKGISRSRVVAIGLLSQLGMSIDDAIEHVLKVSQNPEINAELLLPLRSYFLKDKHIDHQRINDVIVLGSEGFVGSALSKYLSENSFTVEKISKKDLNVKTEHLKFIIRLQSSSAKTVILAAHPASHHTTNAMAESIQIMKNTLEACRLGEKDLIYISGMPVYQGNAFQQNECDFQISEKVVPIPRGTYSETKHLCENLCDVYRKNYHMKIWTVRPAAVYGPRMRPEWLIPKLISKALQNQRLTTHRYRNGLPSFELVHIDDFCKAIELIIRKDVSEVQINIGSHVLSTTAEIANVISRLLKSKSDIKLLDINQEIRNVVSIQGVLEQYGWKPRINIEEGLLSCISNTDIK